MSLGGGRVAMAGPWEAGAGTSAAFSSDFLRSRSMALVTWLPGQEQKTLLSFVASTRLSY